MKHAATPSSATTTTKDNHHSAFNAMYAESNIPQSTQKRQPPGKQPFSSGASRGLIPPSSGRRSSVSPTKVTRPAPASSSAAGPQSKQTNSSSATPVPTISGGGRVLPQSSAGAGGRRVDVATSATRVSAAAFLSKAGVTNANAASTTAAASSSSSALTGGQNTANNGPASAVVSAGMHSTTIGSAVRRSSSSSAITPRKSTVSSSSSSSSVAPSSTLRNSSAQRATRPSTPTAMRTSSSALNNSTHTATHSSSNAVSTSRATTPSKLPKRQQHSKALAEQQFVTDDKGNRYVIKGTYAYFQQLQRAAEGATAYLYETDEINYDEVYAGFKNSPSFMDNSLYRPRNQNQSLEDVKKELEKEAQNMSTSTAVASSDASSAALPAVTAESDAASQKEKDSVRALTPPLTPLATSTGAAPKEDITTAAEAKEIVSSPMFEDEPSRSYMNGNELDMTKESLMSPILFSTRNNAHGQANAAKDSLAFDSPIRISPGSSPSTNRSAHVHFEEEEEDFLADPATPLRTHTNTHTHTKAISSSAPNAATARLLNMSVEEWIGEDEDNDKAHVNASTIEHDTSVHVGESVGANNSMSLEDLFADLRLAPPVRSQQQQRQPNTQLAHTSGTAGHINPSQDHHNHHTHHASDVSAHNNRSPHKSVPTGDHNKGSHNKSQSPEKTHSSTSLSSQENPTLRTSLSPPFVALNPALSSSPVTSKPHSLTHHDYRMSSSPAKESLNPISTISPQKELPKFAISVSSSSSVDSIASSPVKETESISVEVLKAQLQAALLRNDTLQGEMRTLADAKRKEETQHILALTEANSKIQTLQQEVMALKANKSQIEADNQSFNAKVKEVSAHNITLNQLLTAQTVEYAELKTELEMIKQSNAVIVPEQPIFQPRPAAATVETGVQADAIDVRNLLQEVARLTELNMKLEQQAGAMNEHNRDLIAQNMRLSGLLLDPPPGVTNPAVESPLEKRRPPEDIHLPPPPTLTKSEIYVNEFVKKADMLQSSEKECKSIEVGLMDHFKKLAEEAVDCLVELESDKMMIEETFANINFNQLAHDDDVNGIRYRPSEVSFMFGSPSSRFPINASGKNSPSVRGKLGQSGMGSPVESQKKAASHKSSAESSLLEPHHHSSLEEQEIDDC